MSLNYSEATFKTIDDRLLHEIATRVCSMGYIPLDWETYDRPKLVKWLLDAKRLAPGGDPTTSFPVDLSGETVGVQLDSAGKLWICVDGQCVLRVRYISGLHLDINPIPLRKNKAIREKIGEAEPASGKKP